MVVSPIFLPSLVCVVLVSVTKKADVAEYPKAVHHVGLLFNEPPNRAELLFN